VIRRQVAEESILFFSILKWFFLAMVSGASVGLVVGCFMLALDAAIGSVQVIPNYYYLLPLALVCTSWVSRRVVPLADGYSTNRVIASIHKNVLVHPFSVVKAFFLPIITIACGGSAGREAPGADIGAGLSAGLSRLLRLDPADRRKLMICGISAGFAAVFGTPISGAIFGVEVLFVGALLYEVLFPSFVAGIIGYQVASAIGVVYVHTPIKFVPLFTEDFFLKVVVAGIFFGLVTVLVIETLRATRRFLEKHARRLVIRALAGGVLIVLLVELTSEKYLGLGVAQMALYTSGQPAEWFDFLLKLVFTALTLQAGGVAGLVTPVLFIGAASGSFFAKFYTISSTHLGGLYLADLLKFQNPVFPALGMVSLLAGAANTPLSASIMAMELFGPEIAPYAAVTCLISFLMTGNRSIYPAQVLVIKKTRSLGVQHGREMGDVHQRYYLHDTRVAGGLWLFIRGMKKALRRMFSKRRRR